MSNISISIDDELLKKAKKIAIDRDTSFSGLVRDYINELVEKEERHRRFKIEEPLPVPVAEHQIEILSSMIVVELSYSILKDALTIQKTNKLSYWDSLIN